MQKYERKITVIVLQLGSPNKLREIFEVAVEEYR